MNNAERLLLAEIRTESLLGFPADGSDRDFLLRLIDQHDQRTTELIEANNREVDRRRAAVAALRHLRRRFAGTVVDPGAPGAAWVMDVDGRTVWLPEFIDAAIAPAEACS